MNLKNKNIMPIICLILATTLILDYYDINSASIILFLLSVLSIMVLGYGAYLVFMQSKNNYNDKISNVIGWFLIINGALSLFNMLGFSFKMLTMIIAVIFVIAAILLFYKNK